MTGADRTLRVLRWVGPIVLVTLLLGSGFVVASGPARATSGAPALAHLPALSGPPSARASHLAEMPDSASAPQSAVKSLKVGSAPAAEVYDPLNGYVYVSNSEGTTVTILNGTGVVTTTDIGYDSLPYQMTVDTRNGWVYAVHTLDIADGYNVSVINGTLVTKVIPVGIEPSAIAYDNATGLVYVADYGSNQVTIINQTRVVATLGVGQTPDAITVDPANGFVYVANNGSDNVSVIQDLLVFHSVIVGLNPAALGYDAGTGDMYAVDAGSDDVTVLQGTSSLATVAVGEEPFGATYDPSNGDVYVPNMDSGNVSVLNGTQVLGSVGVGGGPTSATYEPSNGYMLITSAFARSVSLLNTTSVLATIGVGTEPVRSVFNPSNGWAYVVNQGSNNVSVILYMGAYAVTVQEAGILHAGTSWSVDVNGTQNSSYMTSLVLWEPNGSYLLTSFPVNGYYVPNAIPFQVDGAPITETLNYVLVTYLITFTESGLATGTSWNITFDGVTEQTTSGTLQLITYTEPNGSYPYTIGGVLAYKRESPAGTIIVSGGPQTKNVLFAYAPEQFLVTFAETGLIAGTSWNVTFNGTAASSATPTISFTIGNGSFSYSVAAVTGYTASPISSLAKVNGGQLRVSIQFNSTGVGSTSTSSSNILGLPPIAWAGILGAIVVVAVIGVVVWKRQSKPPTGPTDETDGYVTGAGPEP
ncbi:MAG: YncE family protein [Thermoplasmata archaeon]|nr:YncE family protein [Thermoplasmata archaeon]